VPTSLCVPGHNNIFGVRLHVSCFVPMSEPQATMTGRSWRHFSIFWPFMVAGLIGHRDVAAAASATVDGTPAAPTGRIPRAPASARSATRDESSGEDSDASTASLCGLVGGATSDGDDGWRPVSDDDLAVSEQPGGALPDGRLAFSSAYVEHFDGKPLHDAYLEMFCQAARVGGMLFGNNLADPNVITEAAVSDIDEAAKVLGVDFIQTLYGYVNTTKLHRLVQHLGDELRNRGNLWEGDTSVNEKLHGSCKRMFKRSNKRGPGVALQMMRCEEAQSAVIRELCEADEDVSASVPGGRYAARRQDDERAAAVAPAGAGSGSTGAVGDGALEGATGRDGAASAGGRNSVQGQPMQTWQLSITCRAQRVAVGDLRRVPALANLDAVLGMADDGYVTQHRTVRIMARFEWSAPSALQNLRAADSFFGKAWYSFIRYEDIGGGLCWGRMRLVLRSMDGKPRSCVVVQRMRRASSRPGCVLTSYGCVRLAWDFENDGATHPALELVSADRILRAEDVQVDWYDLGDGLGLRATPSNKTNSTAERRLARYFTNVFYPWTTRDQQPGL